MLVLSPRFSSQYCEVMAGVCVCVCVANLLSSRARTTQSILSQDLKKKMKESGAGEMVKNA